MAKKEKKKRPIVVVEGAPEWMVTFGDLMSLLLTFFVLLFSVSEVKDEKIYDVIKSIKIHWQIESPTAGFNTESTSDIVELLAEMSDNEPEDSSDVEARAAEAIENPFGKRSAVSKIDDSLKIEIQGRVLFREGSAELVPDARGLIVDLQKKLRGYPNRIRVIGHASPVPIAATSSFDDHDDLAYRRAKAVGAALIGEGPEAGGIRPERFELSSRGARDLLPGTDIFDVKERVRNSRVEIIVTPENAIERALE